MMFNESDIKQNVSTQRLLILQLNYKDYNQESGYIKILLFSQNKCHKTYTLIMFTFFSHKRVLQV